MTLQSLFRYYELLKKTPDIDIALPGYCSTKIHFALNLSKHGEVKSVLPFITQVQQGKTAHEILGRPMLVPEQVIRSSGIKPNFLWDNATYVLGISDKDETKPDYSLRRHKAFCKHNIDLLKMTHSEIAQAIISFLQHYDPTSARSHPAIKKVMTDLLKGNNLVFQVEGQLALEDPEIRQIWEQYYANTKAEVMQCLVTGENQPIARLHPKIKGVRDGQSMGSTLVGFNERAYESYNRNFGQGLNAPVSERATSAYGVALNYLLSHQNPNRKFYIGDTTVVYWAESSNLNYASIFATLFNPDLFQEATPQPQQTRKGAEELLRQIALKVSQGLPLDISQIKDPLNDSTRFYILGLSPNVARLSVRFFLKDAFGRFTENIMKHYTNLQIVKEFPDQPDMISPYRILKECISPKVSKPDEELKSTASLLGGALLRAILLGTPYPQSLYNTLITRVRIDRDDKDKHIHKINYIRVAVIKACLLRKTSYQSTQPIKEALQPMLNQEFTHPAYVLGRLFAVLEKAQGEAIGDANATIKDRYFASACATPRSIFPILLKLSQHHTAKAEYGNAADRRIEQLLNLLEGGTEAIPARLTLDEQGVFILGYYHQRAAFYLKNNEVDLTSTELKSSKIDN